MSHFSVAVVIRKPDATEEDADTWSKRLLEHVRDLPRDAWIFIVDCHI